MGDESWIDSYDLETKQQSLQRMSPQSPRVKKVWQVQSSTKSMLIIVLTWRGLFTMNLFLLTLRSTLTFNVTFWDAWRKRPELRRNHNWLLHHDNAPGNTSLKTTEFVTNNNMVIIPQPPYSLNLAPCDFTLFPKFKVKLKRWRFETVSYKQRELQVVLDSMKENDFHSAYEVWKNWWDHCIRSQGDYFEGHGSQNWVS
jgi:hypothetical protein